MGNSGIETALNDVRELQKFLDDAGEKLGKFQTQPVSYDKNLASTKFESEVSIKVDSLLLEISCLQGISGLFALGCDARQAYIDGESLSGLSILIKLIAERMETSLGCLQKIVFDFSTDMEKAKSEA